MKAFVLLGSPRRKGNTELLVDAFEQGMKSRGASVAKAYLNELKIRGCQACLACHKTGSCRQKDDMTAVYERLLASDVWVIATPVYWWGPTAQIKAAIDRFYCLAYGANPGIIKGKKMVMITACADPVKLATPFLRGMLRESCKFLQMKWAGEIAVQAGPKAEVKKKRRQLGKARALGAKLAGAWQST